VIGSVKKNTTLHPYLPESPGSLDVKIMLHFSLLSAQGQNIECNIFV
jgi:hypothetical protein